MAMSMAAEWQLLYNRFYRKEELYTMCWQNVDLSRHRVACAPFGGPIAIIRDESKIVQLRAESARPKLLIFSASGMLQASVPWDRPGGRLVGMGWTHDQTLVCVAQSGTLFQYSIHGDLQEPQLSLGKECWEQGVAECIIWGLGIACLTHSNQLFCIPDLHSPEIIMLANPNLDDPPLCMATIEPQFTVSGNLEVLLAVGSNVLLVDSDSVQEQGIGIGPIQKMSVSPNGNFLACFTHDGRLLVVSTDFSKKLSEFNTQSALPPEQLIWCGLDSVLLYWEETLLMVGPYGDSVRYPYEEPLVLIPECDGVRILSNSYTEFLQRVPDSTVSIFKIGSTSPAAMLYDAFDHFDRRSARVPEKRFYWLKIKALSTTKNWEALEKISKEKKAPIGFKPFVDACIEGGENSEALKYIVKLSDPKQRAEAYSRIGLENEAREAAAQARDSELLGRLKSTFGQNSASANFLGTLRDRLSLTGGI